MVDRIVLFKLLPDHADDAGRSALAARARTAAAALPALRAVRVGTPADDASLRSWDLLVVLSFDDAAAAAAAVADPVYADLVADPAAGVTKAWSFYSTS